MPKTFYEKCQVLKKRGFSEKQMACYFLLSLREFRSKYAESKKEYINSQEAMIKSMHDSGYSVEEIAKQLDVTERVVANKLGKVEKP